MNDTKLISKDELRALFSAELSKMYQSEVPKYSTLISLTQKVNQDVLSNHPSQKEALIKNNEFDRLSEERHGAIRIGSAKELGILRRLFALYGMYPVGYYDLAPAGIPVHSTAFRPIEKSSLEVSPFRLFTSLLRLELIDDAEIKASAIHLLNQREIISPELYHLLVKAENQGGIFKSDHLQFIALTVDIFKWHQTATVTETLYQKLLTQHRLIADVVGFKGPHINHLTPRTLDIDEVQRLMPDYQITPKTTIEGPPKRNCPILLRQTSFQALNEAILFLDEKTNNWVKGTHTARFGEIEARGVALTQKGRAFYDELIQKVKEFFPGEIKPHESHLYNEKLASIFSVFPDNWYELMINKLAWFNFYPVKSEMHHILDNTHSHNLLTLIDNGMIEFSPIIYEDFLPVSAAGIFQSNLSNKSTMPLKAISARADFESALGQNVLDEMSLYEKIQLDSISLCESVLNIRIIY